MTAVNKPVKTMRKKVAKKATSKKTAAKKAPAKKLAPITTMAIVQPTVEAEPEAVAIVDNPEAAKTDHSVYAVFRDSNGTLYLRVAKHEDVAEVVTNKNWNVELVTIPASTACSLGFTPVIGSSILETVKRLLRPGNEQATISLRARNALKSILKHREITTMETKDTKFAKVKAPKADAPKPATKKVAADKPAKAAKVAKAAKPAAEKKAAEPKAPKTITLKRMPKEGKEDDALPKQAVTILEILKSNSGKLTTDKLLAKLESKLESSQPVARIYAFYRKRLLDGGFISVSA